MRLELHLDDHQFSQLVTKTEFQASKAEFQASIAALATKAELHKELRTQFYWIAGIQVTLMGAIAGAQAAITWATQHWKP